MAYKAGKVGVTDTEEVPRLMRETRSKRGGKSSSTSSTPTSTQPKPATRPKRKVIKKIVTEHEPLPSPSPESGSEFDSETETDEEGDFERRHVAHEDPELELAKQLCMETLIEQQPSVRGVVIREPGNDDEETEQPEPEPLTDKRKLKRVIIDTINLEKEEQKKLRLAARLNLLQQQAHLQQLELQAREGGSSSTMIPPTATVTPTEQPEKDAEGNVIMKEAGEEKVADDQQKESETISPEFVAKAQEEEELSKKTREESAEKQLDDQQKDQDQDEHISDTEMPSPSQQRSPTPERPPIPHGSPPKDPCPPQSGSV